jgi:hypothetical protein
MVHLSDSRFSCTAILWVSLVSFAAITLCIASQRVFIVASIFRYRLKSGDFWICPRIFNWPNLDVVDVRIFKHQMRTVLCIIFFQSSGSSGTQGKCTLCSIIFNISISYILNQVFTYIIYYYLWDKPLNFIHKIHIPSFISFIVIFTFVISASGRSKFVRHCQ